MCAGKLTCPGLLPSAVPRGAAVGLRGPICRPGPPTAAEAPAPAGPRVRRPGVGGGFRGTWVRPAPRLDTAQRPAGDSGWLPSAGKVPAGARRPSPLAPRVWNVRYNHSHDQLVLTGSSDSRVILSNMVSISSEPFGHLVDDDDLSDQEERRPEDR